MKAFRWHPVAAALIVFFSFISCSSKESAEARTTEVIQSTNYQDLVDLFKEWREFQKPHIKEGVPDYAPAAMAEQKRLLGIYQSRLASINSSSWPIPQQVDYHLVRAEMNGLDFEHRVLRPWSRDPGFYTVVSPQFGPQMYGALEIPNFPLANQDLEAFKMKLRAIPRILDQAKGNLTEEAKDLWFLGIRLKESESGILTDLAEKIAAHHPEIVSDVEQAKNAVDEFRVWLEKKQIKMTAPSGVGIENFNWYMKNVLLFPYGWEEQLVIVQRELERAFACLKLEEHRNRNLPKLEPVGSDEEYRRRFLEAAEFIMEFYRKEEIFSVDSYMHVGLDISPFVPPTRVRDFFIQIEYLDSHPMRCHGTHTLDELREAKRIHPSPIRRAAPLYFIDGARAEGLATGNEEMMMHLGYLQKRSPRVRELIYILLANRAARAMGDLKMHSNEFTLEDAVDFAVKWTPRSWLPKEGSTVWYDEQLYLRAPGYGAGYIVGKTQLDGLLAARAHELGDQFNLKQFMDAFYASGMIPMALSRWEIAGLDDEIKKLW